MFPIILSVFALIHLPIHNFAIIFFFYATINMRKKASFNENDKDKSF